MNDRCAITYWRKSGIANSYEINCISDQAGNQRTIRIVGDHVSGLIAQIKRNVEDVGRLNEIQKSNSLDVVSYDY
jgi:hypothetical protein